MTTRSLASALALSLVCLAFPVLAAGETITVTTPEDVTDFKSPRQVANLPGPDGLVSFREAVTAANNTPGAQTIAFAIPRERWWTVIADDRAILKLETGLFNLIDDSTTIDFTTQTAFTGDTNPNGNEVGIYGLEPNGLGIVAILVTGDFCVVKGLDLVLQRGYGVELSGNDNRVISSSISGPLFAGVYITGGFGAPPSSRNVVGGTAPGEGNFLSAGNAGVRIDGPAADNVVVGNELAGSFSGAEVRGGAVRTRIGGPTVAERNVIHGAGHLGEEGCPTGQQVEVENSDDTRIEGNWIGLTNDGLGGFGQRGTAGVRVRTSDRTTVVDNAIADIEVTGTNHCSGQRSGTAISVDGGSEGTVIEGNRIGTDAAGTSPLPNVAGIDALFFPGAGTPSDLLVQGNTIVFSERDGVQLGSGVVGGTITVNSIHDNGELGIDLSGGAANGGQPAPVVDSAASDAGTITVTGTVSGPPSTAMVVEAFLNVACDPSGRGEGELFLGSVTVTTDASGTSPFVATFPDPGFAGDVLTATATDLSTGNTSEFSFCVAVTTGGGGNPPGEVFGLMIAGDKTTVSWQLVAGALTYDVARGTIKSAGRFVAATCVATNLFATTWSDSAVPGAGKSFYYLVRGENTAGAGPWGATGPALPSCP